MLLDTIRNLEQIAVVSEGAVVERGTYDELLTANGLFHQLASRQGIQLYVTLLHARNRS